MSGQQYGYQFQGSSSSFVAGAPYATAFPAPQHTPQHPQPEPSSYGRPAPCQPRNHGDHAGVLWDAVFPPLPLANATANHQLNEGREDMPPPVENIAAQAQPQGLQHVDINNYDMANDYPPRREHIIGDNARIAQDIPAQAHIAPLAPEIDAVDGELQQATAGVAPAHGELPRQDRVPNERATEVLRQLATLYLQDPSSQVAGIHMEPGQANGVMVVITLKLTGL